jgi:TIR domain
MTRIFISYRRYDSAYVASAINEKLGQRFGTDSVFFDIDSIPFGTDFRKYISDAVGKCDILLVVIGDSWVEAVDEHGKRRLDDPDDFVRLELESALKRNIPVIPVLVGEARIPPMTVLPSSLQELTFRNAAEVRAGRDLQQHITRLIDGIEAATQSKEQRKRQTVHGSPQTSSSASTTARLSRPSTAGSAVPTLEKGWLRLTWKFRLLFSVMVFFAFFYAGELAGLAIQEFGIVYAVGAIPVWLAGIILIYGYGGAKIIYHTVMGTANQRSEAHLILPANFGVRVDATRCRSLSSASAPRRQSHCSSARKTTASPQITPHSWG